MVTAAAFSECFVDPLLFNSMKPLYDKIERKNNIDSSIN